jgi:DNA-binding NarL/FixJ family response regulator
MSGGLRSAVPEADGSAGKIRLLVVDDHVLMRRALTVLLEEEPDMHIVGQASNGVDGIDLALRLRPDVVLMDINLPDMNGVEATRIIHRELPAISILALSMCDAREWRTKMKMAGAVGFVSKADSPVELLSAIRRFG